MARKQEYGNESITSLKGADRVRKRPAVIFGSDGVEGCEHAIFEILSNAIDEARDGHGDIINCDPLMAGSAIEVEDFGRGMPVDWNEGQGRYNWELRVLRAVRRRQIRQPRATTMSSPGPERPRRLRHAVFVRMDDAASTATAINYHLHFEKGENVGGLQKEPTDGKPHRQHHPLEARSTRSSPTSMSRQRLL